MTHTLYTPETTSIAFDLHGVVVSSDYKAIIQYALHNLRSVVKLGLMTFNPFFFKDVFHLWRTHAVAGAYLQLVERKYPFLRSTIPFLITIGNMQKRNEQLISFITLLKKRGYTVHLFSNIGDIIFDDFMKKYSDVVQLFDAHCITHKTNGYAGKPYDAAFNAYQALCNKEGKRVIFVDNTKRNIAAATRHGMRGIYYTTTTELIEKLSTILKI